METFIQTIKNLTVGLITTSIAVITLLGLGITFAIGAIFIWILSVITGEDVMLELGEYIDTIHDAFLDN